MLPVNRTKALTDPMVLAKRAYRLSKGGILWNPITIPSGLRGYGLSGMGAMGFDIGEFGGNLLDLGEQWLQNKAEAAGVTTTDIIAMQNLTGQAMDQLSAEYYPLRDAGRVTVAIITKYQQAMSTLINSFCNYAMKLGTPRAIAGCDTISYWGGKWIADRDVEKARLGGSTSIVDPVTGAIVTVGGPGYALPPIGTTATTLLPWILGGTFLYMIYKSSKKGQGKLF
jgi:hypothetical protein